MTIHYIIKYLSYFLVLLPITLMFVLIKNRKTVFKNFSYILYFALAFLFSLVLIYSRFIEPNTINVKSIDIETGFESKIVLISDLHIGAYSSTHFLEKVVSKINNINDADFVVIAGDLTYYPIGELRKLLTPLNKIEKPTYIVLGNHDSQKPGPYIESELRNFFNSKNFHFLKNEAVYIENLNIHILGLGDLWAGEAKVSKLNAYSEEDNLLVFAHSPDTVYRYKSTVADLTLSGHTHGGQIRIPLIYKYFIPTKYGFNEGFYDTVKGPVYVSSGLGISGLPFRLAIPPIINIINTY